jgi:hypothetical protein
MAWARMDDQFYDHPKVLALLDHDGGLAAIGLWSLALGWAKRHADPRCPEEAGAIPASLPRRLGGSSELAKLLVAVGLWTATGSGWAIHDFAHWQDLDGWARRSEIATKAIRKRWDTQRKIKASPQETHTPSTTPGTTDGTTDVILTTPNLTEPQEPKNLGEVLRTSPSSDPASQKSDKLLDRPGERTDVERLCQHLADRIEEQVGVRPPVGVQWRRAARLMLDRDGYREDKIHAAIDWCHNDEFWRSNILSMGKLRTQYVRLRAAATRSNSRPTRQQETDDLFGAAMQRAKAREECQ